MKKRIQVAISSVMFVSLFWVFTGCAGKEFMRRESRPDIKVEQVIQNDPFADIKATPDTTQKEQKDQITVSVDFVRVMSESDYRCAGMAYDPLAPHLLMAFNMLNTSDRVREYAPIFVFKGTKNLDLSKKKPCDFFMNYGGVTRIVAKEGNRFTLNCGEGGNARATDSVNAATGKTVTLYPDVPIYGILIVSAEGTDTELKPGTAHISKISGHAAFFETPAPGFTPVNFRFNYTFERKDWVEEMLYDKKTPFNYVVDVFQKFTDYPLLGRINEGSDEERIQGSEVYGSPHYEKIGPAKKK